MTRLKTGQQVRRRGVTVRRPRPTTDQEPMKRFRRTIDLTAVQLRAAFPHVASLLYALAAYSPRNQAARRTVRSAHRHPR